LRSRRELCRMDVVAILIAVAFFALMWALIEGIERI
jgi:hypothetical protein